MMPQCELGLRGYKILWMEVLRVRLRLNFLALQEETIRDIMFGSAGAVRVECWLRGETGIRFPHPYGPRREQGRGVFAENGLMGMGPAVASSLKETAC
jgi:hypothetical protein